jgi:IPT/TIG domain/Viral BACON domain
MKIHLRSAFIICLLAIIIFSCSKPADHSHDIILDKQLIELPATGFRDSFTINSTVKWKIEKPANLNWFTISKDSGLAGTHKIYLTMQLNNGNTARNGTLQVLNREFSTNPLAVNVRQGHEVEITSSSHYRAKGGTSITIYGRGFSPVAAENMVTINGMNSVVQTATNTVLQVLVPQRAGTGRIIVAVSGDSDTSNNNLYYEWVGDVTVVAGSTAGYLDGPTTSALFKGPEGIEFDANDNLYVADYLNFKVRKITPAGMVSTIPGRIPSWDNPTGPLNSYDLPTAADLDPNGNLIITELNPHLISKYSASGTVSVFAGSGQAQLVNGTGTAASFYHPSDLAFDAAGNAFIADFDNLCVRKITPAGVVTTFAGGVWGYQEGIGTEARFNRPFGIDIDRFGNLFVTDYHNNRIRKITPAAVVTTYAGTGSHGSADGDALTQATFTSPKSIAVGKDDVIFVTGYDLSDIIRIISPAGMVETIGSFVNTATGAPYLFSRIGGLAVNSQGILYAADYYNNRICKITYR